MTKPLDPKFAKVLALMRSTPHAGERQSAERQAETIAKRCGLTLADAIRQHDAPPPPPAPSNFFEGFDDWMESREPGFKARRAAERDDRRRAMLNRKAALVRRYGSAEAALAPCERERLILAAVEQWRVPCDRPYERWTHDLDGYSSFLDPLPDRVRDAVANAYPLPTTFAEAKAEHDYWTQRRRDMEDVLEDQCGDDGLDLVCRIRADMVRDLAEHVLPVTTLADLHARFAMYEGLDTEAPAMRKALFRDVAAMADREGHLSTGLDASGREALISNASLEGIWQGCPIHPRRGGRIADALKADPTRSDRDIARAMGCSPTTVGNVRRALGLIRGERSVQRNGQTFRMKVKGTDR